MEYLLLDFAGNSNSGSSRPLDFYNKPLKDQYAALTLRYSQLKQFGYERFIQSCFPVVIRKSYHISMPNFIRDGLENNIFFNNIIIRPERDELLGSILPKGLEIILIGDVKINPYGEFSVKGIELIDAPISGHGEISISAIAASAFENKIIQNGSAVPNYGLSPQKDTSVLTRDLMLEICRHYTIPDPSVAIKQYEEWSKYISFREYYLRQKGKDGIPFDECEAIKCYVISRRDYQNNPGEYDEHILDNLEGIRKDEQIVVTKQFNNSEEFTLIRVTLNKNKKELFEKTVKKNNITPVFEQKLKRLTRSDVMLESFDGKRRVSVGDRYRVYHDDIEPDYSKTEEQFERNLESSLHEIDARYSAMLRQEMNVYIPQKKEELIKADKEALASYKEELLGNLLRDIAENKDEKIHREYLAQIKAKEDVVRARMRKAEHQYNEKIAAAKKVKAKKGEPSKDNIKENVEKLESQRAEEMKALAEDLAKQKETVSLRALYEERNKERVTIKEARLKTAREETLRRNQLEKQREITARQEPDIASEKTEAQRKNADELRAEKATMKENLTERRYYVYFKLPADDTPDRVNEQIKKCVPKVFKFDHVKESAKINRQKKSLQNFFGGYVKNPFLSTYLLAPKELDEHGTELPDIGYFSSRLNEKQREAVDKAIASESIFLLQGPPGTGKTEVIAEIAAQYVTRGKRLLVSSETHKAIDNVFERLPKIPEIRPLRLIPSQSKKEQSFYSPERLVDNFYINISARLNKEVERFLNFNNYREKFGEEYKTLELELAKLRREKEHIQAVDIQLNGIKREKNSLADKLDIENEKIRQLHDERETLSQQLRSLKTLNLAANDNMGKNLLKILQPYPVLKQELQTLAFIHKSDISHVEKEIASLSDNSEILTLKTKHAQLKEQMDALRDEETQDIIAEKEEEYTNLRGQFIELGKSIKAAENKGGVDLNDLSFGKIINMAECQENTFEMLANILLGIKSQILDFTTREETHIGGLMDEKANLINGQKTAADELKQCIREKDNEEQTVKESVNYESYKVAESGLKRKITDFFTSFDIVREYEDDDIAAALDIIKNEWNKLEESFESMETENREKIPMYKRILKFLRELPNDDSIENDRMAYTKKLFENANVFGLTCTSRENFNAKAIEAFKKYNLDDLDVKKQGIDVVIIDEVSKSSFLDLLIPILYGKTVILVGDHRQLPPMYDLAKMREDDFEGLNPDIIDKSKNDAYTKLYEECIFKTLFENVPGRLRVTLTKQYRCHGDIMKVVNHFYGGSLELGMPNQNDQKQHGLLVKNKFGKPIIENDKHIYFVDCADSADGYEKFGDSTSATNEREARVIIELAKKIDEACARLPKPEVDKGRNIDRRMSMGVICTYGDQARKIKRKLQKNALKNICEQHDERFIVSTVDDFQGDERDIIFVSMVRNPEPKNRKRTRAEFVKKFERINVAFSRARRLLVIVGAKDFLSEATIDLPDMNGNKALDRKAYPVYREIIETIRMHGLLLKAGDVFGEDK